MQLSDATRKRIYNLLKENNMKLFDLSKSAGVSLPTISDFLKIPPNVICMYYIC